MLVLVCTQVVADCQAEVPPPDLITEGGSTPTERRCSFLELALGLAGGLDDGAMTTLYKVG